MIQLYFYLYIILGPSALVQFHSFIINNDWIKFSTNKYKTLKKKKEDINKYLKPDFKLNQTTKKNNNNKIMNNRLHFKFVIYLKV